MQNDTIFEKFFDVNICTYRGKIDLIRLRLNRQISVIRINLNITNAQNPSAARLQS